MVKEMCSMSAPIPIQSIGFLSPDTKPDFKPNFVKRGRTGIRAPKRLPIYPPASVGSLVKSTCDLTKLPNDVVAAHINDEIRNVRTQEDVVNRYVAENAAQTMGDILGVRQGVEYFVNEELFAGKFQRDEGVEETDEGVEETKEQEIDESGPSGGGYTSSPLEAEVAPRKKRSDAGRKRGPNPQTPDRQGMRAEDTRTQTRAQLAAEEKEQNVKLRLRRRKDEDKEL